MTAFCLIATMQSTVTIALILIALQHPPSQLPATGAGNKESQRSSQQSQPSQQQTEPKANGTEANPIVVRRVQSEREVSADQQDRRDQRLNRWATVGLGVLTLIVIFFQAWLMYQQVCVMERQRAIMDKQRAAADQQAQHMLDGLSETRKATAAAIMSANALKSIHRQWPVAEQWEFQVRRISGKQELTATIHVRNKTQLPFTLVTIRCAFNTTRGSYHSINEHIQPGDSGVGETSIFLTDDQIAAYEDGRRGLNIAISGWIHFRDAFGDLRSEPIGRYYTLGRFREPEWRGLAGLHKSLRKLAEEWPFDDWIEQRDD